MERKEFIKTCGMACMSGAILASLMESCTGNIIITGTIENADLIVTVSSFKTGNSFRKYIIAQPEILKYPPCIYRVSGDTYSAILMRCTHQGTQLEVYGDKLECPSHGSEFNDKGIVMEGPAQYHPRPVPVTIQNDQL
jgi:Rieske Fe-S protein